MNLAGLTAVAHTQATTQTVSKAGGRPPNAKLGETWREPPLIAQQQNPADATLQRVLSRERFSVSTGPPGQVTAPAPAEPNRQPSWLLASLCGFAAGLALSGGLAVLAAKRAGRRARVRPAA